MENNDDKLLAETHGITNESMTFKEQEWKTEHEIILIELRYNLFVNRRTCFHETIKLFFT